MTSTDSITLTYLQSAESVSEQSCDSPDTEDANFDETDTKQGIESCSPQHCCGTPLIETTVSTLSLPPLPDSDEEDSIASLHEENYLSSDFQISPKSDNPCEQSCTKSKCDEHESLLENLESCSPIDGTTETFIASRASNGRAQSGFPCSFSKGASDLHRDISLSSDTSSKAAPTILDPTPASDRHSSDSHVPSDQTDEHDQEESTATQVHDNRFDTNNVSHNKTVECSSENPDPPVDGSLSIRLEQANETIRHLLQSRDAMLSSVESLKVLVNSERVVTMATKRKLIATETKLHQEEKRYKDKIAAHICDFEAQLDELRLSKSSLETNLRQTQSLVYDRDEKIQNLTDIHVTVVSERDSAVSKASYLLSQLDSRDERIACLSVQLQDESAKANAIANELGALHGKLRNYDAAIVERDNLQDQCRSLKEELDIHKNSVAEREEERERERLTNASEQEQLQKKLQEKSMKITEMQESMHQLESIERQVAEFDSTFRRDLHEDQVNVGKRYDASVPMDDDDGQNNGSQSLLASVCIRKRDEEILELRGALDCCRNSEREAKSSSEIAMNTLEKIRNVLGTTQNELSDLQNLTNAEREARISAEGKVKILEEKLQVADQNIAQEREAASESKSGLDTEIDQLKMLLDQANQKILTLEKSDSGKRPISHDVGASSPCSAEGNANDRLLFAQTDCSKLSSLAELEEAANLSLSGIKENAFFRRKPARSEADLLKVKCTAIDTDGKTSQTASESADVESIESNTNIKMQEALQSLKHDLECKDNEYKTAMRHIKFNLSPALEAANGKLDETKSQLNLVHKQLRDCEACAESEKATLQNEIGNLSRQLRETLVFLDNSRNELKRSDENVRQLETCIQGLETEKAGCVGTIKDLQEECDRRGKSLAIVRDRLESIESRIGEYKQSVLDMETAKNEAEKIARTEKEGRFVAEQRAIQTDELRHELGTKYHKLAKEKGDIEVHSNVLSGRIQESQNQIFDLELALKEAMASMHSQARYSRARDEKNSCALKEMNERLQERGQHLSKREHDLCCAQKRISKLSSDLAWNKEKLHSRENEIVNLNRDNEEKNRSLSQKRDHIIQLEEELADLKVNCAEAETEISKQRGELCQMRSTVDEKVDLVVNLTNENGTLERKVGELEKEISSEKEHSACSDSMLLNVQKELSVVQNKLQRSEEELKKQIHEAKILEDLVKKFQNATNRAEKVIDEKEHDLVRKQRRAEELEDVLLSLKQGLASLQSATGRDRDLKNKPDLTAEFSSVREKGLPPISSARTRQQLTELVVGLKSEITSRELVEVELKKRFCELEAEKDGIVQKLKLSFSQATQEKELLMERIRNQESVVAEKELLINELEEKIRKFDVFKAQSEEHLEEFRRQNEESKNKIVATEQKLSEEKDHLRAKSKALLQVETQLASRDKEVFALEKELKRLSKRGMEIVSPKSSAMVESKEEAVERLREWCSFINRKLRVAEKESLEREAQLLESSEAVKRLQSELIMLQDRLRGKDSEIRKLTYLQELEVSQLTSRMDALRASFGNMGGSLPHSMNDLVGHNDRAWFGCDRSCRGSDKQNGCCTADAEKGGSGGWSSRWDRMLSSSEHVAPRSRSATKLSTQLALAEYSSASQRGTSSTSGGLEQVCSVRFTLSGRGSPAADVVVYVVGGDVTLGQWDASHRIALRVVYDDSRRSGEDTPETVKDGVVRQCDVLVPASVVTWYKYVADAADGSILWERGNNRLLCLDGQPFYTTNDVWRD